MGKGAGKGKGKKGKKDKVAVIPGASPPRRKRPPAQGQKRPSSTSKKPK